MNHPANFNIHNINIFRVHKHMITENPYKHTVKHNHIAGHNFKAKHYHSAEKRYMLDMLKIFYNIYFN